MNIDAVRGAKVIFTGENVGAYTEAQAKKVFIVGQTYEVEYVSKATFSNFVKIKGIDKEFLSLIHI